MTSAGVSSAYVAIVVVVIAAIVAAVLLFVRPAWALRSRRSPRMDPLPAPPTYPRVLLGPTTGRYAGTVFEATGRAVHAHGLGGRGQLRLSLTAAGLILERRGTNDVLIDEVEFAGAHAEGAVLVLGWSHDGVDLRTRIHLDQPADVAAWVDALHQARRSR